MKIGYVLVAASVLGVAATVSAQPTPAHDFEIYSDDHLDRNHERPSADALPFFSRHLAFP
jgi:hypothetical protein